MATDPLPTPGDEGWRDAWRKALKFGIAFDDVDGVLDMLEDLASRADLGGVLDDIDGYLSRVLDDETHEYDDIRREIEQLRRRVALRNQQLD